MTRMMNAVAPIRLFDTFTRRVTALPPATPNAPTVRIACAALAGTAPTLRELRVALFADSLSRHLAWRGYRVRHGISGGSAAPSDSEVGPRHCAFGASCVHVHLDQDDGAPHELASDEDSDAPIWHVLIGPVNLYRFSTACHARRDWHREHRPPNLADLTAAEVPLHDLQLGLYAAAHHRHALTMPCHALHVGCCFDALSVALRCFRGHVRRLGAQLPQVASYAEAQALLSDDGRVVLADVDAALSENLHGQRAFMALYRAQRTKALPGRDRGVLAAVTSGLGVAVLTPEPVPEPPPGPGLEAR